MLLKCVNIPDVITVVKHLWLGLSWPQILYVCMYVISKAIVVLEVLWQCNVRIHCIEHSVFYQHHIHNTFGGTLKGYKRPAAMNPVLLVFLNIDPQECLVHFVWLPGTAEYRQRTHWRCCKQTAVLILQYSSTSLHCLLPFCTFALGLFEPSSYENLSDSKPYKKVSVSAVKSCLLLPSWEDEHSSHCRARGHPHSQSLHSRLLTPAPDPAPSPAVVPAFAPAPGSAPHPRPQWPGVQPAMSPCPPARATVQSVAGTGAGKKVTWQAKNNGE